MKGHITFLLLTIRKYSDREIATRYIQVVVYLSKELFMYEHITYLQTRYI
jgi:hypothetical protein